VLSELALNCDLPDLILLSSQDYRCESLVSDLPYLFQSSSFPCGHIPEVLFQIYGDSGVWLVSLIHCLIPEIGL
jgi:hypothetical protein